MDTIQGIGVLYGHVMTWADPEPMFLLVLSQSGCVKADIPKRSAIKRCYTSPYIATLRRRDSISRVVGGRGYKQKTVLAGSLLVIVAYCSVFGVKYNI